MSQYSVLSPDSAEGGFEIPRDDAAITIESGDKQPVSEYSCLTCGKTLTYGGRGRKPQYCDEHKKGARAKGDARPATNAKNTLLAEQAADVLVQYNNLAATGLFLASLPTTAGVLADKNDVFRAQCVQALVTDPALCRSILSSGQASARGSLMFAYGLLAAALVPTAWKEIKDKRDGEV